MKCTSAHLSRLLGSPSSSTCTSAGLTSTSRTSPFGTSVASHSVSRRGDDRVARAVKEEDRRAEAARAVRAERRRASCRAWASISARSSGAIERDVAVEERASSFARDGGGSASARRAGGGFVFPEPEAERFPRGGEIRRRGRSPRGGRRRGRAGRRGGRRDGDRSVGARDLVGREEARRRGRGRRARRRRRRTRRRGRSAGRSPRGARARRRSSFP